MHASEVDNFSDDKLETENNINQTEKKIMKLNLIHILSN